MKKASIMLLVATVITINVSGLNPGVGLTFTNNGSGVHSSSLDSSDNRFRAGLTGVVPMGESAELDPVASTELYGVSNPSGDSDFPSDKYSSTLYSVGASYLLSMPLGAEFRFLVGAGASVDFGSVSDPNSTGSVSSLAGSLFLPAALEVLPFSHFGIRVQANLASFRLVRTSYETSPTHTDDNGSFSFGGDSLGLAAFYYF